MFPILINHFTYFNYVYIVHKSLFTISHLHTIIILINLQIPPPPPRPNFDASREKLQRLGEGEGTMTKEEFNKMKQELEA